MRPDRNGHTYVLSAQLYLPGVAMLSTAHLMRQVLMASEA